MSGKPLKGPETANAGATRRIPLSEPDLRGREAEYLHRCIADNWVSSAGPFVVEFERRVAEIAGRRYGVAAVNGTAALHLALIAAGVQPGDGVAIPDWTFIATANAVRHAGAVPLLVDVARASWTLDAGLLARALEDKTRKVRAVIAVHTLGHPADVDALRAVSDAAGAVLIEDAAGAIGARYKGRPVGGLGDLAVFSFNGNKVVTAGGGGMVVTDVGGYAERVRHLSTQARLGADYSHDAVGYNYRMTNLNAAVGLAQIERLDAMLAAKRGIAQVYDTVLAGRPDLLPMPRAPWATSNHWLYSVLCGSVEDAESLVRHMQGRHIEARIFWRAISQQPPYASCPRLLSGVAASLAGRVVSLPSGSGLSDRDREQVVQALQHWRGTAAVGQEWRAAAAATG